MITLKQVVQDVRSGVTSAREVPEPTLRPRGLVITSRLSLLSAGTERLVVELARKNLLAKAQERPDHVRRVLQKVSEEGLAATLHQVRARLDEPMPLGYSLAGVVRAAGAEVSAFKPGDRVAAAGPHASTVAAGENLCAAIPDSVSYEQAAYTSVAAIGLEGVRLARAGLGERVLVIGLGLIGQICVALLKAQGCQVYAVDIDTRKLELARQLGADEAGEGTPLAGVMQFSGGRGVDAVLITASTASNAPIEFAADACRPRGRIVLVGVVGLNLPRPPFFQKELEFTVSASLGPGRWDPAYEEKGQDYPFGHVRWTAGRNMEAVLGLMAQGKLPVEKLTTHRFPIERAADAYDLITSGREPYLGILLEYPPAEEKPARTVVLSSRALDAGGLGVSVVGAGNFARLVLLPALERAGGSSLRGICTAKGLMAEHVGRRKGFSFATTDVAEIWGDPQTHAVFVLTRHNLHAEMVVAALRAGKHVFVEKPLCITEDELATIGTCIEELGERCPMLMVGFNRRFATATSALRETFLDVVPLSLSYRFAPGTIPSEHWTQDPEVGGGRIVGEACHAIDTCAAIAGSPPVRVFAESVAEVGGLATTDDRVLITLRHANGSISSVSYQAGGDRSGPRERIEVFGGGITATVEGWDRVDVWARGKHRRLSGRKDKGHQAEVRAFLNACRVGGTWPIPWEHLHRTTWASLMAVRSLREGRAIDFVSAR